jgi:hypothetical protein
VDIVAVIPEPEEVEMACMVLGEVAATATTGEFAVH